MFDMFGMLGRLGELRERMDEVKQRLPEIEIEESELDGVVKVVVTADRRVKRIELGNDFFDRYRNEAADIITEAVNNAMMQAEARGKAEMKEAIRDLVPDIPGLDIDQLLPGMM